MQLIIIGFCAFFVLVSTTNVLDRTPSVSRMSSQVRDDIRSRLDEAGGCNANICFAIDGSGSTTASEFRNMKIFVQDVAEIVGSDQPLEVAAAVHSTANTRYCHLGPSMNDFAGCINGINDTTPSEGASFASVGISFCFRQLIRRPGEANKIVFLGDGSTIGPGAIAIADLFREIGGEVCVVGARFNTEESRAQLLSIAGGDSSRVFHVGSLLDVLKLNRIVEDLVTGICLGES